MQKKRQIKGFSRLHNQAFVSAWTTLEDTIRVFLVGWLGSRTEARSIAISKIGKVDLSEYDPLDEEDKLYFIVEGLFSKFGGKGAYRFEKLLEPLGLSGPVDKDLQQSAGAGRIVGIGEMLVTGHCLRNVLAHRRGIVDTKTIKECPSLSYQAGDQVRFTYAGLETFVLYISAYIALLIGRVAKNLSVEPPEENSDYSFAKNWLRTLFKP